MRQGIYGLVLLLAVGLAGCRARGLPPRFPRSGAAGTTEQRRPGKRLTVAVLWFKDKTGDPQAAHWRYAIEGLISNQLKEIKAVRLRPGVKYACQELGISEGAALIPEQARKIGELIEAQRVIWGNYRRQGDKWKVSARVLNVATGKASPNLGATSTDWFELRDQLTEQILKQLRVTPSEQERQKMARRHTSSPVALEWYSKAFTSGKEEKTLAEQEAICHKAIDADPQFAKAYAALAAILGSQGEYAEAEQAVRRALELQPDLSDAHTTLGVVLRFQAKPDEVKQKFVEAHRLDPDDPEPLSRLGQLYGAQGKWDEAIDFGEKARLLDPTNAVHHAFLGLMYAHKGERDKAVAELKDAERFNTGDIESLNAEQLICQTYELLGEIPKAVEHYERFVMLALKLGVPPKRLKRFEKIAEELRARLTPNFIEASMPNIYNERALQEELQQRLTKEQLQMVINPVDSSLEIRRWAEQLTEEAESDLDKAKVLFDGLMKRIKPKGKGGSRTAREVFAAWRDPNEGFSCQEYAKLFVALGRDVGLKAFYVHVGKDYRGKIVPHDCAVAFVDGKALLVDVTYRWFGAPHKEIVILDDFQTIAHHFSQHTHTAEDLARCKLATRLHSDSAWAKLRLVGALIRANQWDEARKVLDEALKLEPERWEAYMFLGQFADHYSKNMKTVAWYMRKALTLNPESSNAHLYLAQALHFQQKMEEARDEYRACLRYDPDPETAEEALRRIAQINELIGIEENYNNKH